MSDKLNVFLAGQKSFGAAVLEMLLSIDAMQVVGVSCPIQLDDRLYYDAQRQEIPMIPAGMLNAESLPDGVDLIVCAHAHDFIGRKTRLKAKLGAIGYHPSLLPLHRGRDAIYWTIRFGEKVTGGTVYWLNDTVDGGDLAAQDWCFIQPDDTASTLWRRELFPMGVRLLMMTIQDVTQGRIVAIPQDEALSTWEPSIGRPPLPRPDLPLLGSTRSDYRVIRERAAK